MPLGSRKDRRLSRDCHPQTAGTARTCCFGGCVHLLGPKDDRGVGVARGPMRNERLDRVDAGTRCVLLSGGSSLRRTIVGLCSTVAHAIATFGSRADLGRRFVRVLARLCYRAPSWLHRPMLPVSSLCLSLALPPPPQSYSPQVRPSGLIITLLRAHLA